jgi:leucyl-tRNA synthetase
VSSDIEDRFHFNTAISAVMELVNEVNRTRAQCGQEFLVLVGVVKEAVETTIVLLSPFVPHITEELWEMLGHKGSLLLVPWPSHRPEALAAEKRLVVIQVNGKLRDRMEVPASYGEKEIEAEALRSERVQGFIAGKVLKRVIVIGQKLVNIVV